MFFLPQGGAFHICRATDGLVARVAIATRKFAVGSRAGTDPDLALPPLSAEIAPRSMQCRDIFVAGKFSGRLKRFNTARAGAAS